MKRLFTRVLLVGTLLCGGISIGKGDSEAPPSTVPPPLTVTVSARGLSGALLAETNRIRIAHGCRPLKPVPELNSAAEDQATYMALRLSATHENVFYGQSKVAERASRYGYRSAQIAENVASLPVNVTTPERAEVQVATDLLAAWMASPGHRANLLNRNFTHAGFAARIARGPSGLSYVFGVQVFATPPLAPDFTF